MSNNIKYHPKSQQDSVDKIEKAGVINDILLTILPHLVEQIDYQFFIEGKQHLITESIPALYTSVASGMIITMLNYLEDDPKYHDVMKDDYRIKLLEKSIERLQLVVNNWKETKNLT